MIITATIPLPPSANRLFANAPGKGRVKTAAYKAWITEAGYILNLAKTAKQIDGPYALSIFAGKPDNRKRDLDNLAKPICDLLKTVGAIVDDSLCQRIEMEWVCRPDVFVRVTPTQAVAPAPKPGRAR